MVVGFLFRKQIHSILWGNPCGNDVQITEIRQNGSNKNYFSLCTFENDAVQAAVVGFQFWIDVRNWETILVKMMHELLKSYKK